MHFYRQNELTTELINKVIQFNFQLTVILSINCQLKKCQPKINMHHYLNANDCYIIPTKRDIINDDWS